MPSLAPRHHGVRAAVPLILAAACWGSGTVLSRQAVELIPPLVLLPLQLAVSLAFLGLAIWLGRRRPAAGRAPVSRPLAALGILNPGIAYGLGLLGIAQLSASVSVVVWATEPAAIAILAAVVLGERLPRAAVLLSAIAVAGIGVLALDEAAGGTVLGVILVAAAVGCCAVYTVAARRWLPDAPETLEVVAAQQLAALVVAIAVLAVVSGVGSPLGLAGVSLGRPERDGPGLVAVVTAIGASGVVYYGLAYWLYLGGLRRVSAPVAASAFYLIPVFGLAAATVAGDRIEPRAWLGSAAVLTAVAGIGWLARRGPVLGDGA